MLLDLLNHLTSYTKHFNNSKITLEKSFGKNYILNSGI